MRLIISHPIGRRTNRFAQAFNQHPHMQVETTQKRGLPSHQYKAGYRPVGDPDKDGQVIFDAHLNYYGEQVRLAIAEGQFPLLLSGKTHEYTAPFLVALKQELGGNPKIISYDGHLDCFGNRFNAGGFFRWLIEHKYLRGPDLTIIGAKRFDPYYRTIIRSFLAETVENPFIFNFEAYSLELAKADLIHRGIPPTPGQVASYAELIENSLHYAIESMWCEQVGVKIYDAPQALSHGGSVFISFDADVGYRGSRLAAELGQHLALLPHQQIIGLHIAELDSRDCLFTMSSLAMLFANMIR